MISVVNVPILFENDAYFASVIKYRPLLQTMPPFAVREITLRGRRQCGLFATRTIYPDEVVVAMNPKYLEKYPKTFWRDNHSKLGLSLDCAILRQGAYYTSWGPQTPRWYRLNHSRRRPNLKPVWSHKKQTIEFRAMKRISRGWHLTFDYDDKEIPNSWG